MQKVLIVGIAGGQGRLLGRRLLRTCDVIGCDWRPWPSRPPDLPFYQVDIRSRGFEDVLRRERPATVVHLGFVRHFRDSPTERYDVNVRGTRRLLDFCRRYDVERIALISTSYVYGAVPDNPYFMDEDYPLSGSRSYPELRDLIEVDTLATSFMWRHSDLKLAVLRPVSTLGYYAESTMSGYLRRRVVAVAMGFNPMVQVIHEEDLTEAIAQTVERGLRGVYNVTGPGEIPLRIAIHEAGRSALPVPEWFLRRFSDRLFQLPSGAVDHVKYPCTISGERFIAATGFRPLFSLRETLRSLRA